MKTDILFSSPRLRFSREQQEAVLAWGRELGARDVPTLYAVEKFQSLALEAVGNPTKRVQAESGNVFYINSLVHAMARASHPLYLLPQSAYRGILRTMLTQPLASKSTLSQSSRMVALLVRCGSRRSG